MRKRLGAGILILWSVLNGQSVLRQVTFRFQPVISGVDKVFVAGTFNDWSDSSDPMTDEDGDGVYEARLLLRPGTYQYKFVVDGTWMTDPEASAYADEGRGESNALITVAEDDGEPDFQKGDGKIFTQGLAQKLDYSLVNPLDIGLEFKTRAYTEDVEFIQLLYRIPGGIVKRCYFNPTDNDGIYQYYHAFIESSTRSPVDFVIRYQDGKTVKFGTPSGLVEQFSEDSEWFHYSPDVLPKFEVPSWVQEGIFYQIFPDRFCNGDSTNDQDFKEPYYKGLTELPPGGKFNGEYFHLVKDWTNIKGLQKSPYRTDGRPDLYSFYGGDIQGVMDHLAYLKALGITIIYFNPLNEGKSNHKYDPVDYLSIDPHFADEATFKAFVKAAHKAGIRIIVDMAFNHTGDCHFAFVDTKLKGPDSKYWDWYEWHEWPLPEGGCATPCFFYDCWWDYPLHPNLNYDLSRPNAEENDIHDVTKAQPNHEVVEYILSVAEYWLGELDIDGFRLDVPNEVPFWFWAQFRQVVEKVKPDAFLIGEIWGNAMPWLGPECFHSTMNYKYFRDPVLKFIGRGEGDALEFDQTLTTGRNLYPLAATLSMMNLMGSHDTERFIHQAGGDTRRLKLAALFSMTYPGVPHIYYGDEVGLDGGKDPDNRRPFPWNWKSDSMRRDVHDYFQKAASLRHAYTVLSTGDFQTVSAEGMVYAYLRRNGEQRFLVVLHNDSVSETVHLKNAALNLKKGREVEDLIRNKKIRIFEDNLLSVPFDGIEGALIRLD